MAFSNDLQKLEVMLSENFINTLATAEAVAGCFMQCGKNRNIINYRKVITEYVGATIYALAHHLPMRVRVGRNRKGKTKDIRFRSKVGDLAHLVVLLSLPPKQVLSFIFRFEEIQRYLGQLYIDYTEDNTEEFEKFFNQLSVNMSHSIQNISVFCKFGEPRYAFWVSESGTPTFGEIVNMDLFDISTLSPEEVVKRTRYNISLAIERHHIDGEINLKVMGERFRTLRGMMGISQKQLAEQLGITNVACNRMESGGPVSAGILLTFLLYYSNYFNIDIIFDKRMWEMAQYKHEVMYKKVHITSVLNRKLKIMKQLVTERMENLQSKVNAELGEVYKQVRMGMDSAISLTDED